MQFSARYQSSERCFTCAYQKLYGGGHGRVNQVIEQGLTEGRHRVLVRSTCTQGQEARLGELQCGEESREDGGALGQRANDDVFPRAVSPIAHGAQAVQSGNSKRSGEVSVRAPAS